MKKETKRLVAAHYETDTEYVCDRCGKPAGYTAEPEIEIKRTLRGYENSGDVVEIDCCGECFDQHVVPALKAIGFTPREWDY